MMECNSDAEGVNMEYRTDKMFITSTKEETESVLQCEDNFVLFPYNMLVSERLLLHVLVQ